MQTYAGAFEKSGSSNQERSQRRFEQVVGNSPAWNRCSPRSNKWRQPTPLY